MLSKLNVCLITSVNGTLIISFSKEEIILAQDTLLYHLESLQFFINIKKMVLQPTKLIEFSGIKINSVKMTLQLPPKKTDESVTQCRTFLKRFFYYSKGAYPASGLFVLNSSCNSPAPLYWASSSQHLPVSLPMFCWSCTNTNRK